MSEITYRGWLRRELKALSPSDSLRLSALIEEAKEDNLRLRERVVLYVVLTGQDIPKDSALHDEYVFAKSILQGYDAGEPLSDIDRLPLSYQNAFKSWKSCRNRKIYIDESKASRLGANIKLKKSTAIFVAQIARDLDINKGNLNAYFKHEDVDRLSLESASKVMRYLWAIKQSNDEGKEEPVDGGRAKPG